ncbi:DUF2752 domain-containing protein [Aureivirga marina]|uniref:DUF2752 domain-containing protein n=1 Tax=Aureivirga marina TaxID=1182451 RepID=UPI0018CA6735|nr:DUF2752 domain-containing protein [Aureivirga marina]
MQNRFRFYLITIVVILIGYFYLIYSYRSNNSSTMAFCFYKNILSFPCPTCGTTRSVLASFKADFYNAIFTFNPLGILYAFLLIVIPVFVCIDLIFKKSFVYQSYHSILEQLKNKKISIPLILLLILNWIWNIYKEL